MALVAPLVWADNAVTDKDPSHHGGDWHGQRDHMMAKVLNLTEDQEKQLKDSREKQETAMKSVFEQMKATREAFDAEIVKATPDMNKINDIQTQLKTIQSQMLNNHLNSLLEIKKILTPEQFAGYMALEKARKMMMHEHHKFGHMGGFGKDGEGHKHWGDQGNDKDHDDDQD